MNILPQILKNESKNYLVNYHALKVRGFLLGAESTFSE